MTETAPLKAVCDSCSEEFEVEMKTEWMGQTVEKNFFECPHCHKEYISFCTDQDIRKKQAELKLLWRNIRSATTAKNYNKLHSKIAVLEKEIKQDMQRLRLSVIGDGDAT